MGAKLVGLAKRVSSSGVYLHKAGERLDGPEVVRLGKGEAVLFEDDVRAFLQQVAAVGGWDTNPNYVAIMEFLETPEVDVDLSSLLVVSPMRTQSVVIPPESSRERFSSLGDTVVMERPAVQCVAVPEVLLQEAAPVAPAETLLPAPVSAEAPPEVVVHSDVEVAHVVPEAVVSAPCADDADEVATVVPVQVTPTSCEEVPATSAHKKVRRAPPKEHPDVKGLRLQTDGFYWNPAWDK